MSDGPLYGSDPFREEPDDEERVFFASAFDALMGRPAYREEPLVAAVRHKVHQYWDVIVDDVNLETFSRTPVAMSHIMESGLLWWFKNTPHWQERGCCVLDFAARPPILVMPNWVQEAYPSSKDWVKLQNKLGAGVLRLLPADDRVVPEEEEGEQISAVRWMIEMSGNMAVSFKDADTGEMEECRNRVKAADGSWTTGQQLSQTTLLAQRRWHYQQAVWREMQFRAIPESARRVVPLNIHEEKLIAQAEQDRPRVSGWYRDLELSDTQEGRK